MLVFILKLESDQETTVSKKRAFRNDTKGIFSVSQMFVKGNRENWEFILQKCKFTTYVGYSYISQLNFQKTMVTDICTILFVEFIKCINVKSVELMLVENQYCSYPCKMNLA